MKMTRLKRSETFKVLQWMTTNRELLEPKTSTEAIKLMQDAGQPLLPVSMYNRMRHDLGWETARHRGDPGVQERLAKLEAEIIELRAYLNGKPWNNPQLL